MNAPLPNWPPPSTPQRITRPKKHWLKSPGTLIGLLILVVASLTWCLVSNDSSQPTRLSRVPQHDEVEFCSAGAKVYAAIVFAGSYDAGLAESGFDELDHLHADRYGLDIKTLRLDARRGTIAPIDLVSTFRRLAGCSQDEWMNYAQAQQPTMTTAPSS